MKQLFMTWFHDSAHLRLPIPTDVDGCVLREIFEENSELAKDR